MNSPLTRLRFPTCAAVQRSSSRGFTLLEIMTVVVIIGVFAVLALPSMVFRLRDRKTSAVGQQLATMYRTARMRAIGRGSAVLVRYDKSTAMNVVILEAIAGGATGTGFGCALQPVSSCTVPANRWDSANLNTKVDEFNPFATNNKVYEHTEVDLYDGAGIKQEAYDVCFTPSGVTFGRASSASTLLPLTNIPRIELCTKDKPSTAPCLSDTNNKRGPDRFVYVLPNGVARLAI